MRKSIILAGAALISFGGLAAAQGEGQRQFAVGSFDEIAANGPHRVVVNVGERGAVRAHGTAATLDKMEVVVVGGQLHIRPKKEYRRNFSWRGLPPATFYVTAPTLEGVSLAGSGDMTVDRVRARRFHASVAGSGGLDIGTVDAPETSFSIAGSGTVTVGGRTSVTEISLAGSGNLRGRGFVSKTASVSIAGSGDAEFSATESARISIVGSGGARIRGTGNCTVSRIGSGQARCSA